jgi:hypothetical protein
MYYDDDQMLMLSGIQHYMFTEDIRTLELSPSRPSCGGVD